MRRHDRGGGAPMEGDDFELEAPDLPQRPPQRRRRPDAARGQRRVGPLTAAASGALLLALVMVLTVLRAATAEPPTTPTLQVPPIVYHAPTVPAAWATPDPASIAPPPSCPPTSGTQTIKYLLAPALGVAPLWLAGFDQATTQPVVHFESRLPREYTLRGWAWEAIFATDLGYAGPATVSGGSLGRQGQGEVVFGQGSSVVSALVLDTRAPASRLVSWGEWVMAIYVPGPGCYYVQARWPGGGWRVTFAAGR